MNPGSIPEPALLEHLLRESAARHTHLCPRQVLGVRLGLCGLRALALVGPGYDSRFYNAVKRLLTIVETDGCGADGIAVATDCAIGRRTLRVMDFGKVAATLVDTHTGLAVRVAPRPLARERAGGYAPTAPSRWHAYLQAYQLMPDEELVQVQEVRLIPSMAEIISHPARRAICDCCGEEIMNDRQVAVAGQTLCRPCAGSRYYVASAED